MEIKKRFIVLLSLVFVSFILMCVGTSGNSWVLKETFIQRGTIDEEHGLWKSCSDGNCIDVSATSSWLNACRAFSILSCLAILTALAFSIMSYVEPRIRGWMISLICLTAASTMIVSLVLFLVKNPWTNSRSYKYSWTFVVSWIGVIMSLLTAVWSILMSRC